MNPKARIIYKNKKGKPCKGVIDDEGADGYYVLPDGKKRAIFVPYSKVINTGEEENG